MARVNIKTGKLIEENEFAGPSPEKELQKIVEKHLNLFFQSHYLKSFYKIPGGEIDTLAITEDGYPCIIEFKHKTDDKIINQIVYYYDWLQERSTKFEFERLVKENETTSGLSVVWEREKIRLITVAKQYSKWDRSLIKHLDTNVECYTYLYHQDELDIHLDPIINQFKKAIQITSQINETTLDDHRNRADKDFLEYFDHLRREILNIGEDIEEGYTPNYIKYSVNTIFAGIYVRKQRLTIELRIDEDNFNDPKNLTKDISDRKLSVKRELKFDKNSEMQDVMALIQQAYDYQ